MEKEEIEGLLIDAIKKFCDIEVRDKELNLFGKAYHIAPRDMVCIIKDIEKTLGFSISLIFAKNDSSFMTISNISAAIFEIQSTKKALIS